MIWTQSWKTQNKWKHYLFALCCLFWTSVSLWHYLFYQVKYHFPKLKIWKHSRIKQCYSLFDVFLNYSIYSLSSFPFFFLSSLSPILPSLLPSFALFLSFIKHQLGLRNCRHIQGAGKGDIEWFLACFQA